MDAAVRYRRCEPSMNSRNWVHLGDRYVVRVFLDHSTAQADHLLFLWLKFNDYHFLLQAVSSGRSQAQKPRSWETSARRYALHSLSTHLSLPFHSSIKEGRSMIEISTVMESV